MFPMIGNTITTSRRQGQTREGMSEGSLSAKMRVDEQKPHRRPGPGASQHKVTKPMGTLDRVNAAIVHRRFTLLSGEICPTCGPYRYGSRIEAQPERVGIAIEPYGGCGRHGSRTEGRGESAGITTGPYRGSDSAFGGNAWRDGTEVSRGHSSQEAGTGGWVKGRT